MSFFDKLKERASVTAQTVSSSAKSGMETAKQRLNLKAQKDEITRLYTKLGELFYKNKGEASEEIAALITRIDKLHADVAALSETIDAMSNIRRCPGCGKTLPRNARFCADCGAAVPENEAPAVEIKPGVKQVSAEPFPCPNCGTTLEPGTKVCPICGMEIE